MLTFAGAARAAEDSMDIVLGKALFERLWVAAPSSTKAADGLGPLYNARACVSCHQGGGSGAAALKEGELPPFVGLVLRVGTEKDGKLAPHPVLGEQVQTFAVPGVASEGRLHVTFDTHVERLRDGMLVELRRPRFALTAWNRIEDLAWMSARLAPDLHGVGLMERVPLSRLAALADPDDLDGDGISGSIVMGQYGAEDINPGRFGWKSNEPDLEHQISAAFHADLGLATPQQPELWGDCTEAEASCRAAPHGAPPRSVEVNGGIVSLIGTYLRALPAPQGSAAESDLADAARGATVFAQSGCGACHTAGQPAQAAIGKMAWFHPYSDLLVHDMGDGLADRAGDDSVSAVPGAREWRTAPLWGLGARVARAGEVNLLHDGRARSILEAILWHGGEAAAAKQRAAALSASDRAALIAFLESL